MDAFERYVSGYEDAMGNIVCNIPDYYARMVVPLHKKFGVYTFDMGRTVLCPLHDDHDPSLGLMHDRGRPKVMLYHCLGCGSAGTVVRLHQRVESKYHNRELSAHDACMELCKLFDIPIPEQGVEEDDIEKQYQRKYAMIDKLSKGYTRKTFREELLENRRNGLDLEQAAFSAVKLIASEKRLYY